MSVTVTWLVEVVDPLYVVSVIVFPLWLITQLESAPRDVRSLRDTDDADDTCP